MATKTVITITSDQVEGTMRDVFISTNPTTAMNQTASYFDKLVSGAGSATLDIDVKAEERIAASGTFTCTSVAAGDTAVIEGSTITAVDKKEKTQITCVADNTSSLNDTYFTFYVQAATTPTAYYAWYNVNGAGTDPAVAAKTGIEVAIVEDDTADAVALATRTALSAALGATATIAGATDKVIIRNALTGSVTDAANGAASPGFTFTIQVQGGSIAADQFQITGSDSGDAAVLSTTINTQSALSGLVTSTSLNDAVTVTAVATGTSGNAITTTASGGIAAGAATLAGGAVNYNTTDSTSYAFGR